MTSRTWTSIKLFMDVAAYSERVMGPAHVVNVVDEAIKTALGAAHRGASHHSQGHPGMDGRRRAAIGAPISPSTAPICSPRAPPLPPTTQLQQAAELINAGTKVAILAGRGCLGARDEMLATGREGRRRRSSSRCSARRWFPTTARSRRAASACWAPRRRRTRWRSATR